MGKLLKSERCDAENGLTNAVHADDKNIVAHQSWDSKDANVKDKIEEESTPELIKLQR